MVSVLHLRPVALALGAILLAGCRGTTPPSAPPSRPPAGEVRLMSAGKQDDDESLERVARAHAHYAMGTLLELNEDTEAALDEFAEAAMLDPATESLVLDVAQRYLHRHQPEKALRVLTNTVAKVEVSAKVYTQLGIAYGQLGRTELAASAYRAAIKKSPRAWTAYRNLYLLLLQAGQAPEAGRVLDQAFKESKADADFLVELAELYTMHGRRVPERKAALRARALEALDRAAKLNPRSPHLQLRIADGFTTLGETARAVPIYTNVVESFREFPVLRDGVRAKLADIYLRNNDRARAVEQLEAIVRDQPTNPLGYYHLGNLASEEKKHEQAAQYYAKAVLLGPEFEQAYYDLARTQLMLDRPAEALATLEKAREKFGDKFVTAFLRGMAFARQKDYAEAIRNFTEAEILSHALEPKRANEFLYFQLGAAYERVGDIKQAEQYFLKALELAPDFAEALNYLGYMWAERGENLLRARELIERALKLGPKNPAFLDSMGWVLFKLNRPREALEYLRRAIELSEAPDATLFDHLGDIHAALQEHQLAAEAWRKSLEVEPNESVRKKLEQLQVR